MDEKTKRRKEQIFEKLNKLQEMLPSNQNWGRIQYMIQSALTNVSAKIKKIYLAGSKNMQNKFNIANFNKTQFQIILSQNQLNKAQDIFTAFQKGFKYPLHFHYGKIQLKTLKDPDFGEEFFTAMICKVAVGKTFIFPAKNSTDTIPYQQKPELMSNDFDSVFVYDQNSAAKQFKQNYIIYEPQSRCFPEYIVLFQIDPTKYRQLQQQTMCQLCEENPAFKYCQTEDAYFCVKCDNSHHHNRLIYKHKRWDVDTKPKVLSDCLIHPQLKMQLYCKECNKALCINCKVKGDHANGQLLMHNLARISEKYHETQKILQEIDTELQKKKKMLLKSVALVESKLKQINKKNEELQNRIYEIMQDSLRKLEIITKKKMSLLMSDHIELKRQLDQILWMEKYLIFQKKVLSPNDFLLSYARYETSKKDIISKNFQVSNVMPDMRVEGHINVISDEESRLQNVFDKFEKKQDSKSNLFERSQSKYGNVMKSQMPLGEKIDENKQQMLRSQNNLLNFSILKHF